MTLFMPCAHLFRTRVALASSIFRLLLFFLMWNLIYWQSDLFWLQSKLGIIAALGWRTRTGRKQISWEFMLSCGQNAKTARAGLCMRCVLWACESERERLPVFVLLFTAGSLTGWRWLPLVFFKLYVIVLYKNSRHVCSGSRQRTLGGWRWGVGGQLVVQLSQACLLFFFQYLTSTWTCQVLSGQSECKERYVRRCSIPELFHSNFQPCL